MSDFEKNILLRYGMLLLHEANEADTRAKVIDEIIEKFLGWTIDDFNYEERGSEDGKTIFCDYIIRTANVSIIIEAKKVGKTFHLDSSKRVIQLSGSIMEGDTGSAIKQTRDYCRVKSIPFGVVTNGNQWVIFPGVRTDDVPFSESKAIVFNSLDEILGESSSYFKQLLGRDGVIEGNLSHELLGRRIDQLESRRLNNFFKGTALKNPNPIYPLIERAVVSSFSDTISDNEPDLLDKCYVNSPDRIKFDSRIQMYLKQGQSLFLNAPAKPMKKKEANSLVNSIEKANLSKSPLAIVLLGTVGAGKTTFLNYTFKVKAKQIFEKKRDDYYPHWINIDFRFFKPGDEIEKFIFDNILNYMKDDIYFSNYERSIKEAYKKDIEFLKTGPQAMMAKSEEKFNEIISKLILEELSKIIPYVEKLLITAVKKSPIFLVIDNIDQIEDEDLQSQIFLFSIALAAKLRVNLILAMRQSTYVKHKGTPTFDAFDFDPMVIDAPEVSAVLSRRFFLTKQLLTGVSGSFEALNGAKFNVGDLSIFIDLVQSSVLGTEVGNRIEVLANKDIRLALRMTREFLARGYTDPATAINAYSSEKKYILPRHEAFRSIILGNQPVYSEEYSILGNPFDSRLGRSKGELLRIFVLAGLVKNSETDQYGYIDGQKIKECLNKIGFSESDTIDVLFSLTKFRFIQTSSFGPPVINTSYFSTRLGGYVIKELIADVTFLEAAIMDTFIPEKIIWDKLKELTEQINNERVQIKRIELRMKRITEFYNYILELYNPIVVEAKKRKLDSIWLSNPLSDMKETLNINVRKVLQSADRNAKLS